MRYLFTSRWLHTFALILMLAGCLLIRQYDFKWVQGLGYLAFDTYNRISPREPSDKVVIVDIDESSLRDDRLGQWPWPRNTVAKLVDRLSAGGAKAIVFDMVFAEQDRTSPGHLLKQIPPGTLDAETGGKVAALPDHDSILAESFSRAGNVVTGFVSSGSNAVAPRTPRLARGIVFMPGSDGIKARVDRISHPVSTLEILESSAAGNGFFSILPEFDGIIRYAPLIQKLREGEQDSYYALLALEGYRVAEMRGTSLIVKPYKKGQGSAFQPNYEIAAGRGKRIPVDDDGRMYIHYTPARSEAYIPAWKVIDGQIAAERLRGKIVLVGTSAIGLKDIRSTPLDLYVPGVEVHRNVIEQILQGRYLTRPYLVMGMESAFILCAGLIIIFLAPFINAVLLSFLTVFAIVAAGFISYWFFAAQGLLLDPVFPSLSIFGIFLSAVMLSYIRTEVERKAVKQAFGFYISPDYMKELTAHPDQLRLGGESREITVMFTDLHGFTSISERLKPDELIRLMNDFLTPMSDLVMKNRGTIDKYMGDAMMAFWNAPLEDPDHARHACLAALSMNAALTPVNAILLERNNRDGSIPVTLKAGIGINTGLGAVGNMGSRQRFAYSVLGDTVNLASRLEGQTRSYGVDILIGEETCKAVPDFATLELDLIRVKGKIEPARIYTLLDKERDQDFLTLKMKHDEMLTLYRAQKFSEMSVLADECFDIAPEKVKQYYAIMKKRITNLQTEVLPQNWDGVFIASEK